MGRHHRTSGFGGRLHGNWFRILGGVAAVAVVIAVWQLSSLSDDGEDPLPAGADEDLLTGPVPSGANVVEGTEAATAAAGPSPEESASESASAPATEAPESSTAPESGDPIPAGPSCTAELSLRQGWDGNVEVSVEVVNSGEDRIESWAVTLAFDADLYHWWGMHGDGGDRFVSEDWNGAIEAGGSTDAGFQAEVEDGFELPASVPCEART